MRARQVLPLLAAVTCVVAVPAAAGAAVDVEVIASGLDNPRHVAISDTGDIYVAEAAAAATLPRRSRASTLPRAPRAPGRLAR